jgi:hypothetical protein
LSSFYDIALPTAVRHIFTNKPSLTLRYDDTADPTTLNIYYFNEAQGIYTIENDTRLIDRVNHTITVSIRHASVFTVLASSAPVIRGSTHTGELDVFNFPNPFDLQLKTVSLQNPGSAAASQTTQGTFIKVGAPAGVGGAFTIEIFNTAGEKVRSLTGDAGSGGTAVYIDWDGTNEHGSGVASGVYIGRLTIAGQERFFKMAVLK